MNPRVVCPVPGCTIAVKRGPSGVAWMERHARRPHDRCGCGWAGLSLNGHLGQVKRLGYGGTHRAILPLDQLEALAARARAEESPYADELDEITDALRRRHKAATPEREEVGPTDWSALAPS